MTHWGRLFLITLLLTPPYPSLHCAHPLHTHSVLELITVKVLDLTVMNRLHLQPTEMVRSYTYVSIMYVHMCMVLFIWIIESQNFNCDTVSQSSFIHV